MAKQEKQNKKDNWFKRHKVWTGVIIGVVALFVLAGIFGESPEQQQSQQPTVNGEPVQIADKKDGYRFNDRADKQEKDVEVLPGESAIVDGMKMTVNEVTKATSLGEFSNAESGKTFVVITVTVENVSDRAKPYNGFDFRIQTAGGQVLDQAFESQEPRLGSGDIVPGGKVTGKVVFETPVESAPQYIIWKPNPWMSDRAIVQVQ